MKINKSKTSLKLGRNLVIIATALIVLPATGAVTLSNTASVESVSFSQGVDFDGFPIETNSNASVSSLFQQAGTFTTDFSALGTTTITFTVQAPAGFDFEVVTPSTGTTTLQIFTSYGDSVFQTGSPSGSATAPLVAANSTGSTLPSSGAGLYSIDGDNPGPGNQGFGGLTPSASFRASMALTPGETYQFNSLTASIEIPASVDDDFSFLLANLSVARIVGSNHVNGEGPSLGQFVSLVPSAAVPEPSSILLLGFGTLGLVFKRRRA